jgi:hypothetical protein
VLIVGALVLGLVRLTTRAVPADGGAGGRLGLRRRRRSSKVQGNALTAYAAKVACAATIAIAALGALSMAGAATAGTATNCPSPSPSPTGGVGGVTVPSVGADSAPALIAPGIGVCIAGGMFVGGSLALRRRERS